MSSKTVLSPESSAKIVNIGFVFSLFVAACHVGWVSDGLCGRVVRTVLVSCIGRAVIPFYFVVSAYFLAAHFQDEDWWWKAVCKRMRTIFVPYVFWLTVFAISMLALTGKWEAGWSGLLGLNLTRLPMVAPLWYLRSLMLFVLVSPLIKSAVSRWGIVWIGAMYVVNLVTSILTGNGLLEYEFGLGGFLGYGLAVEGLVYFSLGFYLREHPIKFRSARIPIVAAVVGCLLMGIRIVMEENRVPLHIHPNVLISPFLIVAIWHFAPTRALPTGLASCAFPIYVAHAIVYSILWACGFPRGPGYQWISYAAGIAVPMALSLILQCFAPRVRAGIFGGR